MKTLRSRIRRDERGASLILAIAFMLVAGAIGAAVTSSVASGVNGSSLLAVARDRESAAEGAIDNAIVAVRAQSPASSIGLVACGPYTFSNLPLRGSQTIDIRVECSPAPELTTDLAARNNVLFVACVDTGQPCGDVNSSSPTIIRAEINYQVSAGPPPAVTRTYVQTWSVLK